jgi:cobalt/nickel transport system permease protein
LIVTAAFCHHLPSLWLVGGFAAAAAMLSGLGPTMLFNRIWWFLPGAFVLVAAPATLNLVTPGDALLVLYRTAETQHLGGIPLPAEVSITRQGLASAAMLVTRIGVGVLLAVTITLTTRWQSLLKAAYTDTTAPFVLILAMTYRYIFVLLRVIDDMHLARRARIISPAGLAAERQWVGSRIGALFSRSRVLTERIYAAMIARGYTGHPRALAASRLGWREAAWLLGCGLVIFAALVLDRVVLGDLRW